MTITYKVSFIYRSNQVFEQACFTYQPCTWDPNHNRKQTPSSSETRSNYFKFPRKPVKVFLCLTNSHGTSFRNSPRIRKPSGIFQNQQNHQVGISPVTLLHGPIWQTSCRYRRWVPNPPVLSWGVLSRGFMESRSEAQGNLPRRICAELWKEKPLIYAILVSDGKRAILSVKPYREESKKVST